MKWIGQHIYDLIARFRSDVYLEDISDHGSDPDRFLTMDSSTGKITYRTGSEVLSDIGASSTEGDITGVTAGTNLSGGGATGDVTINLADASTSTKGAASFNSNYFTTSSGAVSLATAMTWADTTITTDSLTLTSANADDPIVTIKNTSNGTNDMASLKMVKDRADNDVSSGTNVAEIYFVGEDSAQNEQEYGRILCEIDVGTNGQESGALKLGVASHDGETAGRYGLQMVGGSVEDEIDVTIADGTASLTTIAGDLSVTGNTNLYSFVYLTWSASGTPTRDGSNNPEWMLPNTTKGIYEEDWNADSNITATSVGTTTYALSRFHAVNSLVIPHDGVLVGFHGHGRNADSDLTFKAGLFHAEGSTSGGVNVGGIDYGSTAVGHEFTLRCVATAVETEASGAEDDTSSHSFKGPCKLVSNTDALSVSPGDVLLPAIMGPDATDEIFVTMTIILKVPLTT